MVSPSVGADESVLREPLPTVVPDVLSAMPPGHGVRLPSQKEEAVASWLGAHRDSLDEILSGETKDHAIPPEVTAALHGPDDTQIWNDYRDLMSDDPTRRLTDTIRFTLDHAGINHDSRVLEVGCSLGMHLLHLVPRSPALLAGLDYNLLPLALGASAWNLRNVPQTRLWVWADALDLPFRNASFTHYHSFVTLSLLPIERVLGEASRVLAAGGKLTITVEGRAFWRERWEGTHGFGRARLARLRELAASNLTGISPAWQRIPVLRGLSRHTVFTPASITRAVSGAGFHVDRCEVLAERNGVPRLIGLTAIKG